MITDINCVKLYIHIDLTIPNEITNADITFLLKYIFFYVKIIYFI
jgi:hypothetical protein